LRAPAASILSPLIHPPDAVHAVCPVYGPFPKVSFERLPAFLFARTRLVLATCLAIFVQTFFSWREHGRFPRPILLFMAVLSFSFYVPEFRPSPLTETFFSPRKGYDCSLDRARMTRLVRPRFPHVKVFPLPHSSFTDPVPNRPSPLSRGFWAVSPSNSVALVLLSTEMVEQQSPFSLSKFSGGTNPELGGRPRPHLWAPAEGSGGFLAFISQTMPRRWRVRSFACPPPFRGDLTFFLLSSIFLMTPLVVSFERCRPAVFFFSRYI